MDRLHKQQTETMTPEEQERDLVERELAEYVKRYFKGALAKATELTVKSSRSRHAVDIQNLASQHYEEGVRKSFDAIHKLFKSEGLLEQMTKLREMDKQQKQFKGTTVRRPTGIASIDTQLLVDVLNTGLLRKEREILEELKQEQDKLIDELTNLSPS
ncbi:uncharacterized protein LOC111265059 [Varroa jacobsoni]|uniref:Uncharacterized protein n=1 Tax=Varroa destructor TaxID=109461 RepID=A0A7M7JC58_VARDE|nr:uncharacterized protein LOC111245572 [Varroa destructor]XP_022697137.1 uncharacterized protein LOC111265059 [Varroa jacobsoni]